MQRVDVTGEDARDRVRRRKRIFYGNPSKEKKKKEKAISKLREQWFELWKMTQNDLRWLIMTLITVWSVYISV